MSEHETEKEDILETLERIAEEQGMHDGDDDSFDAEAGFLAQGESTEGGESGDYFHHRDESMETERSESVFVMGEEEEEEEECYGYPRDGSSFDDSQSTEHASMQYARRGSHSSRRSSFVSEDSAVTSASGDSPPASPSIEKQRSSSLQRRRRSINLTSLPADAFSDGAQSDIFAPKKGKSLRPLSRLSKLGPNTRRAGAKSDEQETTRTKTRSAFMTVAQMGNTELEDTAAAAAVVALMEGATTTKRIQYVVDDVVLVLLNILNLTNSVDPPDAFTVMPVNQYGFPPGEGHHSAEQQGPYVYVMATVKRVHFDEDVPYYTVVRADTLAEQRADVAWMEPLMDHRGIEAATRAAHETARSTVDRPPSMREKGGFCVFVAACLLRPFNFVKNTVIPWYHTVRLATKEHVRRFIWGDDPFYCKFRITGVNLLVLCSFIYMFIEVTALAFFPAKWDYGVAVVGVIVWIILALELMFEWLIRPSHYFQLMKSDKAYAPSTARYIDGFHLVAETVALALFIPQFDCLSTKVCGKRIFFSGVDAALSAIYGSTRARAALGRLCIGLTSLRIVGLVRHWKIMWINRTFHDNAVSVGGKLTFSKAMHFDSDDEDDKFEDSSKEASEDDRRLKSAATIGTALMSVNSHRALILIISIATVTPILISVLGQNTAASNFVDLLQQNNLMLSEANITSCDFLEDTINAWLGVGANVQNRVPQYNVTQFVLWAQLLPKRCDFQRDDGVITVCPEDYPNGSCAVWDQRPADPNDATPAYYADLLGIRVGGISEYAEAQTETLTIALGGNFSSYPNETFSVRLLANENHAVAFVYVAEFLLLASILILVLYGLAVLRGDAGRLVLGPLQRMLKIVIRYAENPLAQPVQQNKRKQKKSSRETSVIGNAENDSQDTQLGHYETEKLISAITKIADLLRKCWGVAGAGIISTNLRRTQDGMTVVFNPTVPGRRVYAIFGFLAIDGFSEQLRALDRDVMILINDVAKVVHDEVYRWALGNSGQCNKNLGNAFLMVFRIGDFHEVHERKARATDVVFSSDKRSTARSKNLRRRGGRAIAPADLPSGRRGNTRQGGRCYLGDSFGESLALASLPGIQTFADRALRGLLKSFAGIYRDKNIQNWKKDFRLGAGVGAFNVNLMIGMDAGWAVEGAVGSEYKIDATYLSPHVNMASRMMSASKQYGVTLLLSQAVEELLSKPAREKLRHLDTVYVKGSSVAQQVFTYDARHQGVDFFLFERSPEQADLDAEAYSPAIWETDQDLRAMRQHVTNEFQRKFNDGVRRYLAGNWESAIATLKEADDLMITTVLEEGFIDYNPDEALDGRIFDRQNSDDEVTRIRNEMGDGACRCLISYMERRRGIPPKDWNGVRPLTSK